MSAFKVRKCTIRTSIKIVYPVMKVGIDLKAEASTKIVEKLSLRKHAHVRYRDFLICKSLKISVFFFFFFFLFFFFIFFFIFLIFDQNIDCGYMLEPLPPTCTFLYSYLYEFLSNSLTRVSAPFSGHCLLLPFSDSASLHFTKCSAVPLTETPGLLLYA